MGESHHHHQFLLHHPPPAAAPAPPRSSRYGGLKGGGGEIVEVQGGHIVRSTGRKDRHSKVCTAKGPRDRRVRLSAHTAIQFYDVQDRLGYDRPSKAVDWLIKNAKAAIDELAELPPWHPTATSTAITSTADSSPSNPSLPTDQEGSDKALQVGDPSAVTTYGFSSSSFLPPSLDSDAIADTIKSFFPIGGGGGASSSSSPIGFQGFSSEQLSRERSQAQDLRLSLQSFQDPILLHHQNSTATAHQHQSSPRAEQAFLSSSSTPLVFDGVAGGWSEHNPRMISWGAAEASGGGGGYAFGLPPPQGVVPLHPVLGQSSFFTQRGPLQSSNSPSSRAWMEQFAISTVDHQTQGTPFGSAAGVMPSGFSGFRIPARIQGEEEHDGISDKPSSAPASRH